MTQKDKLTQLLEQAIRYADEKSGNPKNGQYCGLMADYLLKHFEAIPIAVIERKIRGIDAADGCDQASAWELMRRNALRDLLDWYRTPDYKLTVEHTWF